MKKIYMMLMLAGLSLMGVSCGGDGKTVVEPEPPTPPTPEPPVVTYPTFEAPGWSVSEKSSYEHTMAVVVVLPDSLRNGENASDELAVFTPDDKCRGAAERIEVSSGKYVWMAMVYGNTSTEALSFKYYSSQSKHIYKSDGTTPFVIDGSWGTIDAPKTVGMKIVTK